MPTTETTESIPINNPYRDPTQNIHAESGGNPSDQPSRVQADLRRIQSMA
ncbi:hypothetical protein [Bifidobacterium callitrichos]|nr:hypothetical protein [Bifidobacterium callitrichos]